MRPKLAARSLAAYLDKSDDNWTRGLPARPANALKRYGFSSRAEVAETPPEVLARVEGLGRGGLSDLMAWLGEGADAPARHADLSAVDPSPDARTAPSARTISANISSV